MPLSAAIVSRCAPCSHCCITIELIASGIFVGISKSLAEQNIILSSNASNTSSNASNASSNASNNNERASVRVGGISDRISRFHIQRFV